MSEDSAIKPISQPTPEPAAKGASPIDGSWVLVALRLQGEALSVSDEFGALDLTIALAADQKNTLNMSGYTGVNRFGTSAALGEAQGLMVSPQIRTTRRAGPPAAMKLERQFLKVLPMVDRYRLVGGELQLEAGDTDSVMRFRSKAKVN